MSQRIRSVARLGLVSVSLIALHGCGGGNEPQLSVESRLANEACGLVLAAHAGDGAQDAAIRGAQHQAQKNTSRLPHLERLGWALVAKARSSFDPGFYRLAELTATCMEQDQPASLEALLLRGHALHSQHRFREAEVVARELVERRGYWFDHALLGDTRLEQGDLDEAVAGYERAMAERPGPEMYSRAAHVRWLTGDLGGAIEMASLATRAGSGRDREGAAWRYARLAYYERQAGNTAEAAKHLEIALRLQPDYPPALLESGYLLIGERRFAAAAAELSRAVVLNPLVEYQWAYLEALKAAGQHDQAQAIATSMLSANTRSDPRTLSLYLATTEQGGAKALVLARHERSVRGDVHTLDALAWALHKNGRHAEAYELSRQALAAGTRDARLYYHAGVIALANQRVDEATDWFERALALEHLLLPSERERLYQEFAVVRPQIARLRT